MGSMKRLFARYKAFVARYGFAAILTHYGIFFLVLFGFAGAIYLGFEIDTAGETASTFGAAYLATKVTQPLRIAVTFALTPVVARTFPRLVPASFIGEDAAEGDGAEAAADPQASAGGLEPRA